jgi:putative polyhydroxyalkanoate system protein
MADIYIRREHDLSLDEAHALMDELATEMAEALNISYRKQGDTLIFRRTGAQGSIRLTESEIVIEATLGMMLRVMRPTLVDAIESKLDELI